MTCLRNGYIPSNLFRLLFTKERGITKLGDWGQEVWRRSIWMDTWKSAQCEIFVWHVHGHQNASATEEALNIQVDKMDQSDDFSLCLSSVLLVPAHAWSIYGGDYKDCIRQIALTRLSLIYQKSSSDTNDESLRGTIYWEDKLATWCQVNYTVPLTSERASGSPEEQTHILGIGLPILSTSSQPALLFGGGLTECFSDWQNRCHII